MRRLAWWENTRSREAALENYKRGTFRILIATDVAGRGLDIPDVAHVVNIDMPLKIENYSHRIGRTDGRAKTASASTLLTDSDEAMFYELREYLEQTDADIPQKLEKHAARMPSRVKEMAARGELLRGTPVSTRGGSSRGGDERNAGELARMGVHEKCSRARKFEQG